MDEALLIPVRLAKEGFGGTPEAIANMRTDYVLAAVQYSSFLSDYEETFSVINQPPKK